MIDQREVHVALVDDHTLVRKGLVELVHMLGGYRVVVEAANGREYQRMVSGGPRVDIAIVDLNMPVMDGYETIAWIGEACPETRALALTFRGDDEAVVKAMRNGARGFLLKDIEPIELKAALDSVWAGGYYHSEMVTRTMLQHVDGRTAFEREQVRVHAAVTPREREFLALVCDAEELTYEQIASRMGVHRRTVDSFRESLFEKFGIKSKTGLVLFAIKWGFR